MKLKKGIYFMLAILIFFHSIMLMYKIIGLQNSIKFYMVKNILESLHTVIAIIYLTDIKILSKILKA